MTTRATHDLITRFENGFNTRDIDALMADMTDDVVFEHVAPPAASIGRFEGQAAVRAVWESMGEHYPDYDLRPVEVIADGDRAACRWEMSWRLPDGSRGFARGADFFKVRGGKIAEKLTYMTM
jgi:ketosteroid isomerase-like protein